MASSAVSSVLYLRDAARNHAETPTGANIYCGDAGKFRLDYVSPGKLVINVSKRCQKSVTDCTVTHSSRHKKLASIICVKYPRRPQIVFELSFCRSEC